MSGHHVCVCRDCGCFGGTLPDDVCSTACFENGALDDTEEDGPLDLEDQLDRALDAEFPRQREVDRG